jgi:hypothetical protein
MEITMLSVCLPLITFQLTARFHKIQNGDHATEDDLNAIIFNFVASTVPKWQTFILLRWMQNLHQSTWDHEGLSFITMVTIQFSCDN